MPAPFKEGGPEIIGDPQLHEYVRVSELSQSLPEGLREDALELGRRDRNHLRALRGAIPPAPNGDTRSLEFHRIRHIEPVAPYLDTMTRGWGDKQPDADDPEATVYYSYGNPIFRDKVDKDGTHISEIVESPAHSPKSPDRLKIFVEAALAVQAKEQEGEKRVHKNPPLSHTVWERHHPNYDYTQLSEYDIKILRGEVPAR